MFSCDEREQVQAPAARWLQLQRAPSTLFSVADFSQLQARAGCLPQEQVASFAQTQPPERPQQVTGTVEVGADIFCVWCVFGLVEEKGVEEVEVAEWNWKVEAGLMWCSEQYFALGCLELYINCMRVRVCLL